MTTSTTRRIAHTTEITGRVEPLNQWANIGAMFRPDRIVEVADWDTDANGDHRVRHYVTLYGPTVTKTGKDHATNRGKVTYCGTGSVFMSDMRLDDLPDALTAYVRGADAMLAELGWRV